MQKTPKAVKAAKSTRPRPVSGPIAARLVELRLLKEQVQALDPATDKARPTRNEKSELRIMAATKSEVGLGLVSTESSELQLMVSVAYDVAVSVETTNEPLAQLKNEYRALFALDDPKSISLKKPPSMTQVLPYVYQVEWACRTRAQGTLLQMGLNIRLPQTTFGSAPT